MKKLPIGIQTFSKLRDPDRRIHQIRHDHRSIQIRQDDRAVLTWFKSGLRFYDLIGVCPLILKINSVQTH